MTNGEYYSALSNIMQRVVPNVGEDLRAIRRQLTRMSQVEMINNLHAAGVFDDIEWRRQLIKVAEATEMYEWSDDEKKHLLGSLADEK